MPMSVVSGFEGVSTYSGATGVSILAGPDGVGPQHREAIVEGQTIEVRLKIKFSTIPQRVEATKVVDAAMPLIKAMLRSLPKASDRSSPKEVDRLAREEIGRCRTRRGEEDTENMTCLTKSSDADESAVPMNVFLVVKFDKVPSAQYDDLTVKATRGKILTLAKHLLSKRNKADITIRAHSYARAAALSQHIFSDNRSRMTRRDRMRQVQGIGPTFVRGVQSVGMARIPRLAPRDPYVDALNSLRSGLQIPVGNFDLAKASFGKFVSELEPLPFFNTEGLAMGERVDAFNGLINALPVDERQSYLLLCNNMAQSDRVEEFIDPVADCMQFKCPAGVSVDIDAVKEALGLYVAQIQAEAL